MSSDLLCSMPDEKLSIEHSLSLGLLLASFSCGTDEAAMAVAEGNNRNDSIRVGQQWLYTNPTFICWPAVSLSVCLWFSITLLLNLGLGLPITHYCALSFVYHNPLTLFHFFLLSGKSTYYCGALSICCASRCANHKGGECCRRIHCTGSMRVRTLYPVAYYSDTPWWYAHAWIFTV